MTSHDRGSHAGGPSELVPFTGRGRELAHLVEALERRVPRLILGPAGIGKTRLIGEALARARVPFVRLRHDGPLHKLLVDLALELGCRWPRFSDPRLETSLSLKGGAASNSRRFVSTH
jgi:AAA+ ATPase superfamily predicted ATPase